jgi:hypothetical protein
MLAALLDARRAMRNSAAEPAFGRHPEPHQSGFIANNASELAVTIAHQIAEAVMVVAGPLFWALLAAGYLTAALGHHLR